jgi:preprotein translocase subunit YajC
MNSSWILAEVSPNGPAAAPPPPLKAEPTTGATENQTLQQAPNGTAPQNTTAKQRPEGMGLSGYAMLIAMFVLLYFMMIRGPRKKQQQQKQMLQALKKNDRVQTIGGMLGTVLDVKDDEVLVKVDENNNTKIWFVAGAISRVLSEEKK